MGNRELIIIYLDLPCTQRIGTELQRIHVGELKAELRRTED